MGFNGKTLISVGVIFYFSVSKFLFIDSITPELQRAQIISAISSLIIVLLGFLFKQFKPINNAKADLIGENTLIFDSNILEKSYFNHLGI